MGSGERQIKDIAVNLNFDMVASPNYVRFAYDGDASDTDSLGSTGSGVVEDVFTDYFASQGLATEPTAFDGRSDYDAFINVGIPAGGLFTGAEDKKTEAEAAIYGGVPGVAYDPCYHQACDSLTPVADGADAETYEDLSDAYAGALVVDGTISNLNTQALDEMSDAVAHGTVTFAQTTSAVNGADKGSGQRSPRPASTTGRYCKGDPPPGLTPPMEREWLIRHSLSLVQRASSSSASKPSTSSGRVTIASPPSGVRGHSSRGRSRYSSTPLSSGSRRYRASETPWSDAPSMG